MEVSNGYSRVESQYNRILKSDTTSHWHWDHIGDPSTFPNTTDLVVGPGFKDAMLPGAPTNPGSPILESDYS